MTDNKKKIGDFRHALRVLEVQTQAYREAKVSSGITSSLDAILQHLGGLSDAQILRIRSSTPKKISSKVPLSKAASMTLEEVEAVLAAPTTTRSELESIAVGRFQVPAGSLRSLQNMGFLKDKLRTLVQNEHAHETISSVARELKQ